MGVRWRHEFAHGACGLPGLSAALKTHQPAPRVPAQHNDTCGNSHGGRAMKSDVEIKRDVEAEFKWDPRIDETDIAVKVNGGAVTLSGFARNYLERHQAEQTAKRVAGV